jgi:hypothetical protein
MTNRELIEKRIPYPISDMVIKNAMPNHSSQWLDYETNHTYAWELLLAAFVFSDSPEGFEFWCNIKEKLEAKNL